MKLVQGHGINDMPKGWRLDIQIYEVKTTQSHGKVNLVQNTIVQNKLHSTTKKH